MSVSRANVVPRRALPGKPGPISVTWTRVFASSIPAPRPRTGCSLRRDDRSYQRPGRAVTGPEASRLSAWGAARERRQTKTHGSAARRIKRHGARSTKVTREYRQGQTHETRARIRVARPRPSTDVARRYDVVNGVTVCRSCHMALHGHPLPPPVVVPCACGCGAAIAARDVYGRPRRFVNHHHARGHRVSEQARAKLRDERSGKPLTPEHRARIARSLRTSSRRIGRPPRR